jgi:selenocysteine lyase/cysteine desulfurase
VEYPSNVYPWLDLAERGVIAVDDVPAPQGVVTPEAVAATLRPGTRLVAVSTAQYGSGAVTDLVGLGALCRDRNVLLCVDGIQTVGAMPVDVKAAGVHFLSADSHKWMLGVMGIGAVFVDRDAMADLRPALIGWRSTTDAFNFDRVHFELASTAVRYEEGSLPYPLIAGFLAALEILDEVGMDRCIGHIEGLVEHLADGLESLGCRIGPDRSVRRHILKASHPDVAPDVLLDRLHRRKVVASLRRGALRLSPHFYNTRAEIDLVLETIEDAVRRPTQ